MNADRPPAEFETLLLEFVRNRDTPCPKCGYNLRNLSTAICPECHEPLTLSVGVARPRFGWFVAAIMPGCFSGISAGLLVIPLTVSLFSPSGPAPWPPWAADIFGWVSGLATIVLVRYRYSFLRQPQAVQRWLAAGVWAIHVLAFAMLVLLMILLH